MADLSFIVGIVGNVISILVFASPIDTFRRIVKKKSIENFKGLPYVITLLSTSLWTFYGLLKPGGILIVTVNAAGAALEAIYVTIFLIYAPNDMRMRMVKLVGLLNVGFMGVVVLVTLLALHGGVRIVVVGVLCAGLTIGMYAAPLAAMSMVVRTKSVEYMPFFLSFFLFLNGGVWSIYSVLVRDYFIGVPNVVGFVLGSTQLILYAIYRKKTPPPKKASEPDEEGGSASAHLKTQVEMAQQKPLSKGASLPKPARQHSLTNNIMKSLSTTACELQSIWYQTEHIKSPERRTTSRNEPK